MERHEMLGSRFRWSLDLLALERLHSWVSAEPTQGAKFPDAWNEVLHQSPRLDYFNNNEAMGIKEQIDKSLGWTVQKRDGRLIALALVFRDQIPERFSVASRFCSSNEAAAARGPKTATTTQEQR